MVEVEVAPGISINFGEFLSEASLYALSLIIMVLVSIILLRKSYQGMQRNVRGCSLIFYGLLTVIVFTTLSVVFIGYYNEQNDAEYQRIGYILEFISCLFLLVPCWGFTVLIDDRAAGHTRESI